MLASGSSPQSWCEGGERKLIVVLRTIKLYAKRDGD